ncbi:MAG: hypothetical protein SOT41_05440 [Candidatus Faecisoma sp.]|nr:hypothetical protein [Candidatus Faecisoma sp.]
MKKKIICLILLILVIISLILVFNKKEKKENPQEYKTLLEAVLKNKENNYKKFLGGEVLNENTSFRNYAFISGNNVYIYDYNKLKNEEFSHKKVYTIPNEIKVMNIKSGFGADIEFYDYDGNLYTIHDTNTDNNVRDSYDMYENAIYELSDYLKWNYSKQFLGKEIDYDFMSDYVYVKDNILYSKNYGNEKYPTIEKVSGNYEGEKVIRIYNERILKTDKGFYEIVRYFDTNLNKTITTTMKINLLSKYYDDVLTFTYEYVILKDYTLIPINDVMENRIREYQYNSFISGFNSMEEVPTIFEE